MMRRMFSVLFLSLLGGGLAMAHGISVIAYVDGDAVRVEYDHGVPGTVTAADSVTGDAIHEGAADAAGVYRFRPPDAFLATGHALLVHFMSGDGHRQTATVTGRELAPLLPAATVDAAALEAAVAKVLDAKLSPIREELARLRERPVALRDVIGGLGWILGLLGLATYVHCKRRSR